MPEDLEVGVLLEPKNNLEEEVDDQEVAVGGAGGDGGISAPQERQQEGMIAGGVSKGLAGAAVLAGILSQIKSVKGIFDAVFGFLSRALLPAVEVVADVIRPLIKGINDFLETPAQVGSSAASGFLDLTNLDFFQGEGFDVPGIGTLGESNGNNRADIQNTGTIEAIKPFLTDPSRSADQTGEATLQQTIQNLESTKKDKTGTGSG